MPQSLLADLRNAFRVFKASPLNRIAIVLTLGAATGMNVAIFAVVERVLLSPPRHVAHPESLYSVAFDVPGGTAPGARMTTASYVAFRALRDDVSAFSGAAAWQQGPANVVETVGATFFPARTASRTNPGDLLRAE